MRDKGWVREASDQHHTAVGWSGAIGAATLKEAFSYSFGTMMTLWLKPTYKIPSTALSKRNPEGPSNLG